MRHLLVLVIFFGLIRPAVAADPARTGLFLSFEQRLALSYALLAQGESVEDKGKVLERAQVYFSGVAKKTPKIVEVSNFQEFLNHFRGAWPDTHSLGLDVEMLEKAGPRAVTVVRAKTPKVQGQINRYLVWQQSQLMNLAANEQKQLGEAGERFGGLFKNMIGNPLAKKMAESWLLEESEALLSERIKELDRVGEKIAESSFAKQQDPTMRIFMQTMFSEYFSRLGMNSKKLIISSYLGGDLYADDIKKFEIMVQNSGPQLQKLLQVVARQADLPADVLAIFRSLESSVRSVPWSQVEQILNQEKKNYEFTYFERKPLGVGTMAQVHRAKILVNGERRDVVVRFIKPGIKERVEEDRLILTEVARLLDENPEFRKTGAPKLTPVVDDVTATVTAELSQKETIARQRMAKARYERKVFLKTPKYKTDLEFHVPAIYEPKNSSQLMVQEMIFGGKLDKETNRYLTVVPGLKKAVVEQMARVWAQEVLFGSGFYHSDLHQGNFMLEIREPAIRAHILDFGMGGTISASMQRQVMVLGVGADILSSDLIARAFWELSDKNKNTMDADDFKEAVRSKVQRIKTGREANPSLELWTSWAMDEGLKLPYEFVSLNRGMVIVNKLLSDAGSKETLTTITKSLAKQNPRLVYNSLVVKEKVSVQDLIRLGWSEMKALFVSVKPVATLPSLGVNRCEAVFQ